MVGFIFGILFLIAGLAVSIYFASYTANETVKEYVVDENGNRVRDGWGDYKYNTKTIFFQEEIFQKRYTS